VSCDGMGALTGHFGSEPVGMWDVMESECVSVDFDAE